MGFTERFDRALAFAHDLHRKQLRKGTRIPYIVHLMSVAAIVAENGGTETQVIAGLLHDAVEDQGGEPTAQRIKREFGPGVHRIVMGCTDSLAQDPAEKLPWEERKKAYLAHLEEAPPEMRLVSAADKIHNARSINADLRVHGQDTWDKFKGGREGTLWYYKSIVKALREGWEHPIIELLEREVREMVKLAKD